MIRLLAGYKTQSVAEVPTVIYVGADGVELQTVASKQGGKGFVRMRWFQLDGGIPISVPAPAAAAKPVEVVPPVEPPSDPVPTAESAPVAEGAPAEPGAEPAKAKGKKKKAESAPVAE